MARKLFISFLGTGFYEVCTYYDSKNSYTPTRYIQQATIEQIGVNSWAETDAVRVFVTDKAFADNWDKNNSMRFNYRKNAEESYERLGKILYNMDIKADIKPVLHVPVGNDEKEMWRIFQMVFDEIHDGDELYIDLTHAFRYLPMLVLVLSNYAKLLKHTTIRQLSYGNYEARDKDNRAPIVNLVSLSNLQDWTLAAADFLDNGHAERLKEMAQHFQPEADSSVGYFVDTLEQFTVDRQTYRGAKITDGKIRQQLHDISQKIDTADIPPLTPLLQTIRERVTPPAGTMERVVSAAQWCLQNRLWQQSLSILQEGIVTFFCQRHHLDIMEVGERNLINSAFTISLGMKKDRKKRIKWRVVPSNLPKMLEILNDPLISDDDICKSFNELTALRNNYMHAGYEKGHAEEISGQDIENAIRSVRDKLLPNIDSHYEYRQWIFKDCVFLNISNHPSEDWDEAQRKAAEAMGTIQDMPFPDIPVNATDESIEKLARKTAREIFKKYDDDTKLVVHVMGEMTFTFHLVSILKNCGIECVAACSKRMVKDLGDGKRLSQFRFSQFRKY